MDFIKACWSLRVFASQLKDTFSIQGGHHRITQYATVFKLWMLSFHFRNSFFQFLYLFLVSTFHAVGIYDGLAAVEATEPHSHHLLTLIIILAINIFAFLLCSYSDPGIIKKECSLNIYWQYPYDEVIFLPNTKCPTCGIIKPARSKHCS